MEKEEMAAEQFKTSLAAGKNVNGLPGGGEFLADVCQGLSHDRIVGALCLQADEVVQLLEKSRGVQVLPLVNLLVDPLHVEVGVLDDFGILHGFAQLAQVVDDVV